MKYFPFSRRQKRGAQSDSRLSEADIRDWWDAALESKFSYDRLRMPRGKGRIPDSEDIKGIEKDAEVLADWVMRFRSDESSQEALATGTLKKHFDDFQSRSAPAEAVGDRSNTSTRGE